MEEFARDIGYLDKFFDKLAAHAAQTKSGPLAAFVDEERARWRYALQLLEGGAPASSASSGATASKARPDKDVGAAPAPLARTFTVGSTKR